MIVEESVRWRVIRAILGVDKLAMAKRFKVSPNTIRNWECGRTVPNNINRKIISQICHEHNISIRPDGFPVPSGD